MNLMTYNGYNAKIEYDAELDMFRGEILGLTGGADFYGKNPKELRAEFKRSLEVFLEVCREKGIAPRRNFSGKFNLRIPTELHEKLAIVAHQHFGTRGFASASGCINQKATAIVKP
jgi:predicted HicB family RNase H-like nuclease